MLDVVLAWTCGAHSLRIENGLFLQMLVELLGRKKLG